MLTGHDHVPLGSEIQAYVRKHGRSGRHDVLTILPIICNGNPVKMSDIEIDYTFGMAPSAPDLVLFTSGTTGKPKGTVLPRRALACLPQAEKGQAVLSYRPLHWAGGCLSTLGPVMAGNKLYSLKGTNHGQALAKAVLAALGRYAITEMRFSPPLLRSMKEIIVGLSSEEQAKVAEYFKSLNTIKCGTGLADPSIIEFWTSFTGLVFESIYASTELGGPATHAVSGIKVSVIRSNSTNCKGTYIVVGFDWFTIPWCQGEAVPR